MSINGRGRPIASCKVNRRDHSVGNLIRRARIDQVMSLYQVADYVGVTVGFISNVEQGKAPLPWDYVKPIAELLSIPMKALADANLKASSVYKSYALVTKPEVNSAFDVLKNLVA